MKAEMTKSPASQVARLANGWEVSIETITPQIARFYLENFNVDNRKMTRASVIGIRRLIDNGEFETTPQGIVFGESGRLLDGQTRLQAISESGITQVMQVHRGVKDELFKKLDQGRKRSFADIFRNDKRVQEPLNVIADLHFKRKATQEETALIVEVFCESASRLVGVCGSTVKGRSSAAVKAAAVIKAMEINRHEDIFLRYRNFVNLDIEELPKSLLSLFRQIESGVASSHGGKQQDLIARAFIAFDPSNYPKEKILIKNTSHHVQTIRDVIASLINEHKEKR
jgi:hypothetical protein